MRFTCFTSSVLLYTILGATYPSTVEAIELTQESAALQVPEFLELAQAVGEGEGETERGTSIGHRKKSVAGVHHHWIGLRDSHSATRWRPIMTLVSQSFWDGACSWSTLICPCQLPSRTHRSKLRPPLRRASKAVCPATYTLAPWVEILCFRVETSVTKVKIFRFGAKSPFFTRVP